MSNSAISLSTLVGYIEETIYRRFAGETFRIRAEITDVKKQPEKRWCFLKFIEKEGHFVQAEIRGVFWNNSYAAIQRFETATGQQFANGLAVTCLVNVKFHARFGLTLEVQDIDASYTIGQYELEKQRTLNRLLTEHADKVRLVDGEYITKNQKLPIPTVPQRIALVTAPGSDGLRDFSQELKRNVYGYAFKITPFLCQVQGDSAAIQMAEQLNRINNNYKAFDAIAIVRGGGSITDLKPFDDFALALAIASSKVPVLTGIGHDSNTSIADMMARQFKTPTKVAAFLIDTVAQYDYALDQINSRIQQAVKLRMQHIKAQLSFIERTFTAYDPAQVLKKGYAYLLQNNVIVSDASTLDPKAPLIVQTHAAKIETNITRIKQAI